jgi:L,D-transpeptidase ErfK/SrfK|uniref:L,D-TPase catalytic domain-containing protein n=1 Tax=Desulfobacca acetoxidans TaxID=60893 RepID=A0A7C3SL28_9BACT
MPQKLAVILAVLFGSVFPANAFSPCLYYLVRGGEELLEISQSMDLTRLAQEKGVRWEVVAQRNQLKKPYRLKPGMMLVIDDTHIVPTELSHGLVINLPELKLYHFYQGAYQRRYSLGIGKRDWQTPEGDYFIVNKAKNPTWLVPASIQEEMAEAGREVLDQVPPGPRNPLGPYWLGTSAPGVGIHATNRPWSVGHLVSHGCIRMLPEEIAQLFPLVEVGAPVKIIYQPVKMALTDRGKIFLEAHPDVYRKKVDAMAWVQSLVTAYRLQDRIDWDKVVAVLKAKDGIAREVTKEVSRTEKPRDRNLSESSKPRQLGLFPLQPKEARVE